MKKLTLIFLLLSIAVNAQKERFKWSNIDEIKFYNLTAFNCDSITSIDKIPKEAKFITYKTNVWEPIFLSQSIVIYDVESQNTCYVLVVKFKRGNSVPFRLFENPSSLQDMRSGHYSFINLKKSVYKNFDRLLKQSIECIRNPDCNEIK